MSAIHYQRAIEPWGQFISLSELQLYNLKMKECISSTYIRNILLGPKTEVENTFKRGFPVKGITLKNGGPSGERKNEPSFPV